MKYLKLFEDNEEEKFIDADEEVESEYDEYFTGDEDYDELIKKIEDNKVDDFILDIVHPVEDRISQDIIWHIEEHPYISTSFYLDGDRNNWYGVLQIWVEEAEVYTRVQDKLKDEIRNNYDRIQKILEDGIEEEPTRFEKFKNLNIYRDLESMKDDIMEKFNYLNRGEGAGLFNAKTK